MEKGHSLLGDPGKELWRGSPLEGKGTFWIPIGDATCVKEDLSKVSEPPALHQSQVDQLTIHLEQLHAAMERRLVRVAAPSTGWLGTTWSNHPCEALPKGDPETLPQGDAKGEPDMEEGKGPIDNGSDLPVPRPQRGKRDLFLQSSPWSPIWVDLGGGGALPTQSQGSGRVSHHLPPKK